MNFNGREFKTAFILGCGATRGALPHVIFKRKRIKPPLNADFFKVAETYARACGPSSPEAKRVKRLKYIFSENLHVDRKSLTMETAFSLLFMAKDFPEIYSAGRGRRRMPGDRPEIEDFLRLTSDILTLIDRDGNGDTEYDALAAVLRPHDIVISLNYDTLLDSALVRRGWNPKQGYGIIGTSDKFKWRPKISDPNLCNVRLLKLHGSLNWFVPGSFSNLSTIFFKKPTSIEKPRMNERRGLVRQIIPPIYGKFFDHDHWRNLWATAYSALLEVDVLVVIGCSLIETDFHLRALIGRVAQLRKGTNKQLREVFLVDQTKVRRRWEHALKGSFKRHTDYKTFSQFMKKEIRL
jgi:hypothetical protein